MLKVVEDREHDIWGRIDLAAPFDVETSRSRGDQREHGDDKYQYTNSVFLDHENAPIDSLLLAT